MSVVSARLLDSPTVTKRALCASVWVTACLLVESSALSEHSLDAFCRREHRRLVGALSLYCGDHAVAEDIAQEALYRACRQWSTVSGMTAPGAWVHRVAINIATSAYRRSQAERRAFNQAGRPVVDDGDLTAAVVVRQAVHALPPRQRAALVLRHYLGYSVHETAALLRVSDGAVKQLTHRAISALRQQLLDHVDLREVPDAQ